MKNNLIKGASILSVILMCSMVLTPAVTAAPPQPFNRWGYAWNGSGALLDTQTITAWIDGVEYGRDITDTGVDAGAFNIDTYGDTDEGAGTEKDGGYNNTDTVYYVHGDLTTTCAFFVETNTWVTGGFLAVRQDMNLTLTPPARLKISNVSDQSALGDGDYVVIYNMAGSAVDITGYSLAVGTAAPIAIGTDDNYAGLVSWNVNPIPAGSFYAISMTDWGNLGDGGNSIKISQTATGRIVDRVEYGTIGTEPEDTNPKHKIGGDNAPATSGGQQIYRTPTLGQDTNDYSVDFIVGAESLPLGVGNTATATGPDNDPAWSNDNTITITYTTTGSPASVDLYYTLSTASPYTWVFIATDNTPLTGYDWTLGGGDGQYSWYAKSPSESAPIGTTPPERSYYQYDGSAPSVNAGVDHLVPIQTAAFSQDATVNGAISGVATYAWLQTGGPGVVTFTPSAAVEDPTVSATTTGTYTIQLTVTDNAGNSASDSAQFAWDNTAPYIISVVPADNATGVSTAAGTYVITFSEAMQAVGTPLTDLVTPSSHWDTTTVQHVDYGALASLTLYTVDLTGRGYLDTAGLALVNDMHKSFTTAGGGTLPEQVDDLNATRTGTGILLQWTAATDATSYVVYRTPNLNFSLGGWVNIAEVATLYYNDTTSYADGNNYAYVVHSKNGVGENSTKLNSVAYKCVYALDYSSSISGGTANWISLPYGINITSTTQYPVGTYTVNDGRALRDEITGNAGTTCTKVSWWDPTSGTKSWSGIGAAFALVPGRSYQVTTSSAGTFKMVGWYTPASYQMAYSATISGGTGNWISLPYNMDLWATGTPGSGTITGPYNSARSLRDNITVNCGMSCTKVSWWDPTSGTKSWSGIGVPFALVPGRGYSVTINAAGTPWTCPVQLPGP